MAFNHVPSLTPASNPAEVAETQRWWKAQLLPAARAAVKARQDAGENVSFPESAALILASYAATDMLLVGRTLLLPTPECVTEEVAEIAQQLAA